jgi:hypothetical protein
VKTWPTSVPVISTADLEENPHLYSTHYRSLPGLWGMFRKIFPLHHQDAISILPLAVATISRIPALSSRSKDRKVILFNLTCSLLGYTEGQSHQTLLLTERAYAIRANSCTLRVTD